jgi:multimeric flavodoxin WrbA
MRMPHILGISASLRNARSKGGAENLIKELEGLDDRAALDAFVHDQANIHLDQFLQSGRNDGLPFDELYRRLRSLGGHRGLSNSEVCLAVALWGARQSGCTVELISLHDHFPADGSSHDLERLKERVLAADGLMIASPVYFGDRSSLSQRLIEMFRADPDIREAAPRTVYAGVTAGAKRNGGQETTLIYQMSDMLDIGFLAVGNDSDTTSQYGGTAHAGDIGTIASDTYGIDTCLGTGRRIARVTAQLVGAEDARLKAPPLVDVWMLQERLGALSAHLAPYLEAHSGDADFCQMDLFDRSIRPCIACDICPTHVGQDNEYRCIIKRRDDGMVIEHNALLRPDIIMPAAYSSISRDGVISVYQEFMERTRYLRRGDYVFSDRLVSPIVFAEIGTNENLNIRMMTSLIRHHTVMHRPMIGWIHKGKLINEEQIANKFAEAIAIGAKLTAGRLALAAIDDSAVDYNPVGYILSVAKDKQPETVELRAAATQSRRRRLEKESIDRLAGQSVKEYSAGN